MADVIDSIAAPPPAYSRSSPTNDESIELPKYSQGRLFSNYRSDVKQPRQAIRHESASEEYHRHLASLDLRQVEAGNIHMNAAQHHLVDAQYHLGVAQKRRNRRPEPPPHKYCGIIVFLLFGIAVIIFLIWLAHHYNQ